MISALRVWIQLTWAVAYESAGQERIITPATSFGCLTVGRIYGSIDLVPGDEYMTEPNSGFHYFVWAGATTVSLRSNDPPIEVAVLEYDSTRFLVPLADLVTANGTEWDRRVTILAWETVKLASAYEVTQEPSFGHNDDGSQP